MPSSRVERRRRPLLGRAGLVMRSRIAVFSIRAIVALTAGILLLGFSDGGFADVDQPNLVTTVLVGVGLSTPAQQGNLALIIVPMLALHRRVAHPRTQI